VYESRAYVPRRPRVVDYFCVVSPGFHHPPDQTLSQALVKESSRQVELEGAAAHIPGGVLQSSPPDQAPPQGHHGPLPEPSVTGGPPSGRLIGMPHADGSGGRFCDRVRLCFLPAGTRRGCLGRRQFSSAYIPNLARRVGHARGIRVIATVSRCRATVLTIELPASSWAAAVGLAPGFPALTSVSPSSVGTLWVNYGVNRGLRSTEWTRKIRDPQLLTIWRQDGH
jgi:hypothetical protein